MRVGSSSFTVTKSAEKPRHSCRGGIGVGRAGLNAQEPNKTHAVPEPSMGEGTAEVEAPAFMPGRTSTDGLQAYAYLVPGAKHVLCRFHHQQGVTHWLKQHFTTEAEIDARQPAMKRLFQTPDKRAVRRRLARLNARAAERGVTPCVTTL